MKTWRGLLVISAVLLATLSTAAWQKAVGEPIPKYDKATEATFKGTVEEVKDRQCPVSRGLGSQLMLKKSDGTVIEVHLALTKFVTQNELVFQKGDALEVTGVKVKFEGVDTIFARKIKRGKDECRCATTTASHSGNPEPTSVGMRVNYGAVGDARKLFGCSSR